jgi:hypothetical protein
MSIAIFGGIPLVLAGVIVAAFVIVAPGRGAAASNTGFAAGPAPSAQQFTASAVASPSAPSPSPSHKKKKPHKAATPTPSVKLPAVVKAKPAHKASKAGVTPHNLGLPNFAGYCQHIGARTAELTASNAYGWHCALNPSRVLNIASVCAYTYHLSTGQVTGVSTNYADPNAWQCWRINRDLGALDVAGYCKQSGQGTSLLVAENAYGWECSATKAAVSTTVACDTVYGVNDAVARFAVYADPYSWQCWD